MEKKLGFIDEVIERKKEELAAGKIGDIRYNSLLDEIKNIGLSEAQYKDVKNAIDKYINVY
ncbi:MAG: hypothetical protein SOY60_08515 [Fusobacterium gastrosuis]|uniref:hypothetical protein n=1 Tax=Fusobacterium gastrosuis TaxID=1755100 RepID=UPI002973752D|nr:hypothetical protein [Fusobacteriaceae bacterium]MDY4011696.1 hypothetical protein [Fusobacterium gastrosuis]MDY5712722.1 hypothetical protein [Fusobacterium gastrosuis]